jgi:hypothetical protein
MHKSNGVSVLWSLLAASAAVIACSSGETENGESVYVMPSNPSGAGGVTPAGGTGASNMMSPSSNVPTTEPTPQPAMAAPTAPTPATETTTPTAPMLQAPMAESTTPPAAAPPAADPATPPEAPKIVLFDGTNLDAWVSRNNGGPPGWQVVGDGTMVVTPGTGDIITKQKFEDLFVHLEYKTPVFPANVTGQERGNSGVYLKTMYEMQVLDSFGRPPEIDGCGAVYEIKAPLTVACFQEEVWNTYDIEFVGPKFDNQGNKVSNARVVSAKLNNVLVQDNTDVPNGTRSGFPEAPGPAGLMLQDHNNRISFRNIFVIPR